MEAAAAAAKEQAERIAEAAAAAEEARLAAEVAAKEERKRLAAVEVAKVHAEKAAEAARVQAEEEAASVAAEAERQAVRAVKADEVRMIHLMEERVVALERRLSLRRALLVEQALVVELELRSDQLEKKCLAASTQCAAAEAAEVKLAAEVMGCPLLIKPPPLSNDTDAGRLHADKLLTCSSAWRGVRTVLWSRRDSRCPARRLARRRRFRR